MTAWWQPLTVGDELAVMWGDGQPSAVMAMMASRRHQGRSVAAAGARSPPATRPWRMGRACHGWRCFIGGLAEIGVGVAAASSVDR